MHSMIANAAQPYELSSYPTFTAEVASTCHELLLANMMVEQAKTKEDKLFYLGHDHGELSRDLLPPVDVRPVPARVNDLATKGEGLSGEKMAAIYLDLLKRYHGPNVRIEPDYASEWSAIPHFYFGFYVWQYATSITAANLLRAEADARHDRRPRPLPRCASLGRVGLWLQLLKKGGLDMATAEPYQLIVASFSKVLDQAEALI